MINTSLKIVSSGVSIQPLTGLDCPVDTVPFPDECVPTLEANLAATAFLWDNMPAFDQPNAKTYFDDGIVVPTVDISLSVKANTTTYPWAADVSRDLFFDYVLPYANVNEARTNWRALLSNKISPLVANSKTLRQAADAVNAGLWGVLGPAGQPIYFKSQ
jgi:hypothetical protein